MDDKTKLWGICVGIFGALLPLKLFVFGHMMLEHRTVPTLSDYFHGELGWLFVGGLIVVGVSFLVLSPILLRSSFAGIAVCLFSLGTAFFPTPKCTFHSPISELNQSYCVRSGLDIIGVLHIISAVGLLFLFSWILISILPRRVRLAKRLTLSFRLGGLAIASCAVASVALALDDSIVSYSTRILNGPIFWIESAAILIFSTAWITYSLQWNPRVQHRSTKATVQGDNNG